VAAVGLHYILEFLELRDLVQTDHRTGLLTPTAWRDSAERTLRQQPLAILMADLDHFKRLNDSHGHLIGDSILQQVGNILLSSIRPVDLACRWGGEEFVLMLVGTSQADAVEVAERIRRRVGAEAISNGARITISIGVATCRPVPPEQLASALTATIGQADDALYRAKRDGRNRVAAEGADIR
jgi:diguanylate cyclase (GGDEF)-like protein